MGCLFSKCRSSFILNKSGSMPPNTRVQRTDQTHTNGIARVPKLNLDNNDEAPSPRNDRLLLRIKPPPPAPPPSPPNLDTSQRHSLTVPRSSEEGHSIIKVQKAEDLRPSSLMTSDFPNSPKSHRESSVTVSDVRLNPSLNGLKRTSSTRREEELSIEELDTDFDDYSRLSIKRYNDSGRLNPTTTDILLPRRKNVYHGQNQKPILNQKSHFNSSDSNRNKETTTGIVTRRNDTPIPNHHLSETKERNSKQDTPTTFDIIREQTEMRNTSADDMITIADETPDHNGESKTNHSVLKNDTSRFIFPSSKTKIGGKARDTYTMHTLDKPGKQTDIDSQTDSNSQSTAVSIVSPKQMYDNEMEKKRQQRKRKRGTNKRHEYVPGKLNDNETSMPSFSVLKDRPDSNTSKWTLDSRLSFGSNATMNSFQMDTTETSEADRYSYIQTSSTPISFKALTMDIDGEQTEIIDLEDDDDDPNNTTWLDDDSNHDKDKHIDGWYGVKPYQVFTSTSGRESGIITEIEREPSSSEIATKKKLLYSRFSRRPQSETLLRGLGKPPLPPGAAKKVRPVSDTGQRTLKNFSKHFTTDLDIH